jgi:hypothetical protein
MHIAALKPDWINGAVEVLLFLNTHTTQIRGLHHCLQWNKTLHSTRGPFGTLVIGQEKNLQAC